MVIPPYIEMPQFIDTAVSAGRGTGGKKQITKTGKRKINAPILIQTLHFPSENLGSGRGREKSRRYSPQPIVIAYELIQAEFAMENIAPSAAVLPILIREINTVIIIDTKIAVRGISYRRAPYSH